MGIFQKRLGTVKEQAQLKLNELESKGRIPANAKLGIDSRYYLVKAKWQGRKFIETFGLEKVGKEVLTNFGYTLVHFTGTTGTYRGIGGKLGFCFIPLNKKIYDDLYDNSSYGLTEYNAYIVRYTPFIAYEDIDDIKVGKNSLTIKKVTSEVLYVYKAITTDDFYELAEHISKCQRTINAETV